MSVSDWSTISMWVVVAAVFLIWSGISLYAFWRAGRMNDRAQSLRDLADFLDTMIKTDHRYPIWVWPDGRLQADAGALSLVGLSDSISSLDELVAAGGKGLPANIIETIRQGLSDSTTVLGPLIVDRGRALSRLIIDVQWLPSKDVRWPFGILWLEEAIDQPTGPRRHGVRSMELQLKDLANSFNSLPYPVWARAEDDAIVEVNSAYISAVDAISSAEVIDRQMELFGRGSLSAVRKARECGHPVRERRFGVIEGQRRAFAVTNTPLESSGSVLSIAIDVTGEEEALSELSRVLESQSETLNRLRSPVAIFGPGQTLRFYNSAFARLSHLGEDVLSSAMLHSELLDAMREKRRLPEQINFLEWKASILRYYTTLLEPFEEMWHLPDGSAHRVVTQPHPLGGLLILFEDVTDSLALERSYNTLMAVQQETLDNMTEGVAVFGTDGRLQLSNPAFLTLWNLDKDDAENSPHLTDLVKMMQDKNEVEVDEEHFIADLAVWAADRKHKTGRLHQRRGVVVDCAIVPLPDGGVMLTQNDITDTFKVERALRERSNALEAADRLKSEFITSMSYELRTPLNSISGFAEMLELDMVGKLNKQQAGYVHNILSAATELTGLIGDVLDLAVIEAGEVSLILMDTDVCLAMREAAELARELAQKSDIELILEYPDTVGTIAADERRLKQAFYNMVSSMLSFARHSGKLTVEVAEKGDSVFVSICNPDCGLAPSERDRLVAAVGMGASPGGRSATGLDLSLVRSIVSLHQGQIALEAYEEEGLLLRCTLPREQVSGEDA
ncbi:MAG: PAS-domain containing protein [Kordiimonadaceae bacterium]|nr:PAS-domain containing protein [Kordiimonadaceae bacterium]